MVQDTMSFSMQIVVIQLQKRRMLIAMSNLDENQAMLSLQCCHKYVDVDATWMEYLLHRREDNSGPHFVCA